MAKPWLEVINTSRETVELKDVTLRYYYTPDGDSAYRSNCVQTSLGCSNITWTTGPAAGPDTGHYLQIGFTAAAGSLAPGKSSEGIGLQLYRVDRKKLNQVDDYSFTAENTTYTPSKLVTAHLRGAVVWGEGPDSGGPASVPPPEPAVAAPPAGILFDDFDYTGPGDPALSANGWEARNDEGGPGIKGTWSRSGISFPAGEKDEGQALRLRAGTDGTPQGTRQAEFRRTEPTVFTGTLAARVYFSDKPRSGSDGDHVTQSFFTISPDHTSSKYSELDYEYLPNGGWGRLGPLLDTTSWHDSENNDRVTSSHAVKLGGWHTLMITAVDGSTTYSVDDRVLFTSGSGHFPRERMSVNFSAWFIDLPFKGPRSWDMRVDWLYYQADRAVSAKDVQKAVAGLTADGTHYVNTLPRS